MSLWAGKTIPCSFDGFAPLFCMSTSKSPSFRVAEHGAVGRVGSTLEPLGADSPVFSLSFVFTGTYFEAHKIFLQILDAAVIPLKPSILIHPVWGEQTVYPIGEVRTRVDAKELTAFVEVTFKRHFIKPDVSAPYGPFLPVFFLPAIATVNLAGYLAALAFLEIWNSKWLAAALTIMRLAGQLPEIIDRTSAGLADSLHAFVDGLFPAYDGLDPPHVATEERFQNADAILAKFRNETGLREAVYQGIIDGTVEYEAGIFGAGVRSEHHPNPRPDQHAGLLMCAVWQTAIAGRAANDLTNLILAQDRGGTLDAASADAAVVSTRRRIRTAIRLTASAMPYHGGAICSHLSQVADSLTRLLTHTQSKRPPTRTIALRSSNMPLVIIALEELRDATRTEEIRALNPEIRESFNRLPRGTELKIPAQ